MLQVLGSTLKEEKQNVLTSKPLEGRKWGMGDSWSI